LRGEIAGRSFDSFKIKQQQLRYVYRGKSYTGLRRDKSEGKKGYDGVFRDINAF